MKLNFVLILAVPVDRGGSVSHNVRVTCFLPRCMETTSPGGERVAAPETDLQLAAGATRIQAEQSPAPFSSDIGEKSNLVAGIKNNY